MCAVSSPHVTCGHVTIAVAEIGSTFVEKPIDDTAFNINSNVDILSSVTHSCYDCHCSKKGGIHHPSGRLSMAGVVVPKVGPWIFSSEALASILS